MEAWPDAGPEPEPTHLTPYRPDGLTMLQEVLLLRYVATVSDLVRQLPEHAVLRALEQNTGFESLAVAIGDIAVDTAAMSARHRYERIVDLSSARASLIAHAGGAITAVEAAALLGGITRQAVEKRRERGTLLAVMLNGECRYPMFQFEHAAVLAGLSAVLKAFSVRDGWTQLSVLLSPHDALDKRTVVDALTQGDVDAAVGVAASFGDTGS